MEWTNGKVMEFLNALPTEPCLWDPRHKSFKNRIVQNDAWRRLTQMLPFPAKVEDLKKKKESLMGYYRIHLNKYKKSKSSGAEAHEVYATNWFAFEAMNSFLGPVYESSKTIYKTVKKDGENGILDTSDNENNGNANNSTVSCETEDSIHSAERDIKFHYMNNSPPEISAARWQMEIFTQLQRHNDEYETFGRLIAIKLKNIQNTNTRDAIMNDIHNLMFHAYMKDIIEQQSSVP